MKNRLLVLGLTGTCVVAAASGVAVAAKSHVAAAPAKATIKQSGGTSMKPNQYVKDTLRWNRNVYKVKSGGTLHLVDSIVTEGPHTFTVVKKNDRPKNAAQMQNCKVCNTLIQAHGADPSSDAPPKFQFLENGVGSDTPPVVDRPGDSALIGQGQKGESLDVKVGAKKGTTLYFMCLIHPWMQAKVLVG